MMLAPWALRAKGQRAWAADAHDARLLGSKCQGPGQLMLMMHAQLGFTWQGPKRLMLMMLAWRSPVGLCLPKG